MLAEAFQISFGANDTILAVLLPDSRVHLIDTASRTVVSRLPGPGGPDCMELSADGALGGFELTQPAEDVTVTITDQAGQVVLMVRIGMGLQSHDITGYVLFLMDMPSLDQVIRKVRLYFGME